MRIDLIAVGKRMSPWIETAVKEYVRRLPENIQFKLIEITPATRRKNNSAENFRQREQENIEAILAANSIIVCLDERGKTVSSQQLAAQLNTWHDEQQHISIIIGGADGISAALKGKAQRLWSLSNMTLPHGLVRVIMLEQIYRAWTIIQNHPYHRK